MDMPPLFPLVLAAPLYYRRDPGIAPFAALSAGEEILVCFAITPGQDRSIEPEPGAEYLGAVLGAGRLDASGNSRDGGADPAARLELPAGNYFFAQSREVPDRDAFMALAVEVQKEALWQRLNPEPRVYLRRLREDGKTVTQVLRPLEKAGS
jgi:hypothetical protein